MKRASSDVASAIRRSVITLCRMKRMEVPHQNAMQILKWNSLIEPNCTFRRHD
jgi:hypothetical protein